LIERIFDMEGDEGEEVLEILLAAFFGVEGEVMP
jgi:hypothetical protein